jgi:intracellular septation protein
MRQSGLPIRLISMKFLYDLLPLLLFFAAYKYFDIYVATGVAIAASVVQTAGYWFKHRRFETMHLVTLGVIVVFGGLTVFLRDDTFIKWKPTLVYWILALLLLGSQLFGSRTIMDRMLSTQIVLPPVVWRKLNLSWALFFLALGVLNLYVAFYYGLGSLDEAARTDLWVKFKVFGLMAITFVFIIAQAVVMARYAQPAPNVPTDDPRAKG